MKKNSLLSVLLLAALASGASAAQAEMPAETVTLPTYVVAAERDAAAPEQRVNDSLAKLRALANTPVTVAIELPALKAHVVRVAKVFAATRVAKS